MVGETTDGVRLIPVTRTNSRSADTMRPDASERRADFLKELPCRNSSNFAHYQADAVSKCSHKKAAVYLPTNDQADSPDQQSECYLFNASQAADHYVSRPIISHNNGKDEHSAALSASTVGQEVA